MKKLLTPPFYDLNVKDIANSRQPGTGNATGAMTAVSNLTGSKTIVSVSDLKHLECAWGFEDSQAIMKCLRRPRIRSLPT